VEGSEGSLDHKPRNAPTRWVTRERPKIDRIACPWLIARFVDANAEFLYVPPKEVLSAAKEREAVPYDIPTCISLTTASSAALTPSSSTTA